MRFQNAGDKLVTGWTAWCQGAHRVPSRAHSGCSRARFSPRAEAVFRYCSLASLPANKLVRPGVVAKGAEKSVLELSISSTYTILCTFVLGNCCHFVLYYLPKRRFVMHKEPLHWTVQHLNGGSRAQKPAGSSEAAAAPLPVLGWALVQ